MYIIFYIVTFPQVPRAFILYNFQLILFDFSLSKKHFIKILTWWAKMHARCTASASTSSWRESSCASGPQLPSASRLFVFFAIISPFSAWTL